VKVKGRVAVTKKRCAAEGLTTDRYATPDVSRVTISPSEIEPTDTETETETEPTEAETPAP